MYHEEKKNTGREISQLRAGCVHRCGVTKVQTVQCFVTGSTRRIDIIAFKESTRSGYIIDPTYDEVTSIKCMNVIERIRFESHKTYTMKISIADTFRELKCVRYRITVSSV
ncbi:hypothetical protein ANN_21782 [Periplaneta americana]|uniref:Uncharacterized protein n=1 Tax=Periplaneta americana TaxID=6978 RepID=A0ABQ8S6D7_PERAM|nr:hypothetical protein ANN_21782 [Periplaneta americana]